MGTVIRHQRVKVSPRGRARGQHAAANIYKYYTAYKLLEAQERDLKAAREQVQQKKPN